MRELVSEASLRAAGVALGRRLPEGAVVWLEGDLGAGKTTFAQAVVAGLGVTDRATSPTYALVHSYPGPSGPVHHVDCYRLRAESEAADLGWDDLAAGRALLVEWPERGGAWVPPADARVRLGHADDPDVRWLEVIE